MPQVASDINTIVTLIAETCCNCGIAFGIPSEFRERKLKNRGEYFYCPAGHSQHYTGETDAARYKRYYEQENTRAARLAEENARKERQLSAARGRITKIKNRVSNGVCPCCSRTFANLARHMHGQHPGFVGQDVG